MEHRATPATYIWVGQEANNNWSTPGNWRIGDNPVQSLPGPDDDVVFQADAANANVASFMDHDWTVRTLEIQDRPDPQPDYRLTLEGTLQVREGLLINPGVNGKVTGGSITFIHVETSPFTWQSGEIGSQVDVIPGTVLRIETPTDKKLTGQMTVNTGDAQWDGLGKLTVEGANGYFRNNGYFKNLGKK